MEHSCLDTSWSSTSTQRIGFLYLDLELPSHKESPQVISEMEQATGVSAQELMALRPLDQHSGEIMSRIEQADNTGGRRSILIARYFLGYWYTRNIR